MNELKKCLEVLLEIDSRVLELANWAHSQATPQKCSKEEREAQVLGVKSTSLRSIGPASLALGLVQDGVSQDDGCWEVWPVPVVGTMAARCVCR